MMPVSLRQPDFDRRLDAREAAQRRITRQRVSREPKSPADAVLFPLEDMRQNMEKVSGLIPPADAKGHLATRLPDYAPRPSLHRPA